jgi:hypothetical protein
MNWEGVLVLSVTVCGLALGIDDPDRIANGVRPPPRNVFVFVCSSDLKGRQCLGWVDVGF